jgi:hypothetical protein
MSDDLDPQLAQWFAGAQRGLPDADFVARFAARLRRERRFGAPWRIALAVFDGTAAAFAAAFAAPFRLRLRLRYGAMIAAAAIAMTLALALQT